MNEHVKLDGLVPARLAPKSRKIVLDDYCVAADIGFHDFEVGAPQRLLVTVGLGRRGQLPRRRRARRGVGL